MGFPGIGNIQCLALERGLTGAHFTILKEFNIFVYVLFCTLPFTIKIKSQAQHNHSVSVNGILGEFGNCPNICTHRKQCMHNCEQDVKFLHLLWLLARRSYAPLL